MTATLKKRSGKNNWEICYTLPIRLRKFLKTPALYRSLGTPDKSEAKRRFPIKLIEVEAEVAGLTAEHFPDDETAKTELEELISMYKTADDGSGNPDAYSDKEAISDALIEWGQRQKRKRLRAYRGTDLYEIERKRAEVLESEADELVGEALSGRTRITDLIDHWRRDVAISLSASTNEEYERAIKRFLIWCRKHKIITVEQVARRHVREFVSETYEGRLGKTVNSALGALNSVWDHAHTMGWSDEKSRVWKGHGYKGDIKIGTGERRDAEDERLPLTFEDVETLLDRLMPPSFADMIRVSITVGGARSGEISALKPEHVYLDEDGFWVSLPGTKTGSAPRRVPVARAFDPFIKRLLDQSGEYLIPIYPDKTWTNERDRNRYINKELNRKRREIELPDGHRKSVHSARYLYTEMLEGAGVTTSTIKLLVGHKRNDITLGRYSSGSLVDLREAVEKMEFPEGLVLKIVANT